MGSFANSLHVQCDDADDVIASIDEAMREAGYDTTDESPGEDAMWGMPSALRAMHVAESRNGWVAVLDSDLMHAGSLAADLSRRLETYAIQFMVNDSDSWYYQLFHNGSQIDEFDSSGGLADDFEMDEMSPEIAEMISGGGFAAMQNDLTQRMNELAKQMEENMPADIRAIQERMETGTTTPEEMKRYSEWAQAQSQQVMGELNELASGMMPGLDRPSVPESDLSDHVEKLRPILPPDATGNRVRSVLGKQAVFAEQILEEFMTLVGLQSFFANLSYRYLEECTESDLLGAEIKLAAHLKYTSDGTSG